MVSHSPSLLPALGDTQLPSFSGTILASDLGPSWYVPTAVCPLLPFFPKQLYVSRSLLAQVCDFPALGGEEALRLTQLSSDAPTATVVSGTRPGDLPVGLQKFPYCPFLIVLCTL